MTEYLSLGDVIAIHDYVMRRQGWATAPLRDEGALESAIMRPRTAAHYEDADLTRQAVLLAVGISQAQAFLDGNKRAAYQAMDAFLLRNGRRYDGKPLELAEWFVCIAEQSSERDALVDSFEDWLRVRVVPI
jgi:death-on-curing protein